MPTVYDDDALAQPWERARPILHPTISRGAWPATDFALPVAQGAAGRRGARVRRGVAHPGRPIGEAVTDLMHRIHADFHYDKTATTVTSRSPRSSRSGPACARTSRTSRWPACAATGWPPATSAATSRPARRRARRGWSARTPRTRGSRSGFPGSDEWLAFDPTNDQWADDRYVTVAWGRDYGDVPPVKGVIFTEAKKSTLRVAVDVAPIEDDPARVSPRPTLGYASSERVKSYRCRVCSSPLTSRTRSACRAASASATRARRARSSLSDWTAATSTRPG